MQTAITTLYNTLPSGAFKTGTTDYGREFACHVAIKE
jgi:IS30 family transposase